MQTEKNMSTILTRDELHTAIDCFITKNKGKHVMTIEPNYGGYKLIDHGESTVYRKP